MSSLALPSSSSFFPCLFWMIPGLLFFAGCSTAVEEPDLDRPPNFIIIFTDDQGYGDLSCFGHPTIRTPHLDRMATEGQKWTQFYVAAPVCTPSRAGLLTGRLPVRNGMTSAERVVLFPDSGGGLPGSEVTIAEVLKQRDYATAAIGKWHLGHLPQFLPTAQGFDFYFGVPYSNDMDREQGKGKNYREQVGEADYYPDTKEYRVPLLENETEIERPADQRTLTRRYVERSVQFIEENRERPFFLYLAHNQPHIPLFADPERVGSSKRGLYGDAIEEIDWGVGAIRRTLDSLGLSQNTLVVFTSDNGPWLSFRQHGGSAGPLRAGKGTTFEGGQRVPAIFWGPGLVAPGLVTALGSTLDLLPTFAALAGCDPPADRKMDGYDLGAVLRDPFADSPREAMYFWTRARLQAVRIGRWKLHLQQNEAVNYGRPPKVLESPELYDLETDPAEAYDRSADFPEIVGRLLERTEAHLNDTNKEMTDNLAIRSGTEKK